VRGGVIEGGGVVKGTARGAWEKGGQSKVGREEEGR